MDADVRESLLRAGRISREVRERAVALVKEGALLLDVAEEAEDLMRKRRAKPAFLEAGEVVAIEPFASSGAGQVDGRRTGNIYRVLKVKPQKATDADEFLGRIADEFKTLPFAERWAHRIDSKAPALLNALVRTGAVMTYPALLDLGGGIVSQTEHTMIVGPAGAEVTTA